MATCQLLQHPEGLLCPQQGYVVSQSRGEISVILPFPSARQARLYGGVIQTWDTALLTGT